MDWQNRTDQGCNFKNEAKWVAATDFSERNKAHMITKYPKFGPLNLLEPLDGR